MNTRRILYVVYTSLLILFYSCMGGGTHGSIKAYIYPVKKDILQNTIEKIISINTNIQKDTPKYSIVLVDGEKKDTAWDNYYNDDTGYVTINIKYSDIKNNYIFRYYADKEYWDTSKTSEIFIAYAHDKDGYGGSEGNGGVKWHDFSLRKRLLEPFEKELISKIDSILGMKHTEE